MNQNRLAHILLNYSTTKALYKGSYPKNVLPNVTNNYPAAYIVNLDLAHLPGSHWVGIFVNKNETLYFDSYGRPPMHDDYVMKFIKHVTSGLTVKYNAGQIQQNHSSVCGFYCITFIIMMSIGLSYKQFLDYFDPINLYENDSLMCSFIKTLYECETTPCNL